jgi:RNA polymerase sigma factor (TIGR02999 family)
VEPSIPSLMAAADRGNDVAARALFAALYAELHGMARRELSRAGPGMTLGVTTLLHDAYLEMAARDGPAFPDRARFMGYAARVMRGLVIDYVRSRRAAKRGGQFEITALDGDVSAPPPADHTLDRVGEALDRLASVDASLAEVVDLKFFCGFSFVEIAAMRGVSERTVQRQWDRARIYLHRSIGTDVASR